jgi:hypothetical protein
MRRALYLLTAVPVFLTAALILLEVVLLPVVFFWMSREHSSRDAFRILLTAAIGAAIAAACILAGRNAERSQKAVVGCLLVACFLFFSALYRAYDLAHNSQPASMRGEALLGFLFVVLPGIIFGLTGLIGSIGLMRISRSEAPHT